MAQRCAHPAPLVDGLTRIVGELHVHEPGTGGLGTGRLDLVGGPELTACGPVEEAGGEAGALEILCELRQPRLWRRGRVREHHLGYRGCLAVVDPWICTTVTPGTDSLWSTAAKAVVSAWAASALPSGAASRRIEAVASAR